MTLTKEQQDNLEFLCDREATICAVVEILLDHKLMTCDEFLTLKKKHFNKLKPAVDEAVEHFAEPVNPAQVEDKITIPGNKVASVKTTIPDNKGASVPDNESATIQCNVKIGLSANSYDEARQTIAKLKAACKGNYTFNVDFNGINGTFSPGISAPNTLGGLSTFSWNFTQFRVNDIKKPPEGGLLL